MDRNRLPRTLKEMYIEVFHDKALELQWEANENSVENKAGSEGLRGRPRRKTRISKGAVKDKQRSMGKAVIQVTINIEREQLSWIRLETVAGNGFSTTIIEMRPRVCWKTWRKIRGTLAKLHSEAARVQFCLGPFKGVANIRGRPNRSGRTFDYSGWN